MEGKARQASLRGPGAVCVGDWFGEARRVGGVEDGYGVVGVGGPGGGVGDGISRGGGWGEIGMEGRGGEVGQVREVLADGVDDGDGGGGGEVGAALCGGQDVELGCEGGVGGGEEEELDADFHGGDDENRVHEVFWADVGDCREGLGG